jgi:hypothetical protein
MAGGDVSPAASVLQSLGQIPVEKRGVGRDACGVERIKEPLVEVEAFGVRSAGALGEDARPGDREAEGLRAQILHQGDVLFIEVIKVVGHVGGFALMGLAGRVRKGVPHGGAAAVGADGALDLISGGCGAPQKSLREGVRRGLGDLREIGRGGAKNKRLAGRRGRESEGGPQEAATFHVNLGTVGTAYSDQRLKQTTFSRNARSLCRADRRRARISVAVLSI